MANVILVAYLLIVLALIVVILLQRSEGGALGIGGGGGGGFMTARGSANLLTRTTAILAVLFFATAIGLTVLSEIDRGTSSILEQAAEGEEGAAPTSVLDALNSLQSESGSDLSVPAGETPAGETAPAAPASDLAVPEAPAADPAPAGQPSTEAAPAAEAPATEAEPAEETTQTPAAPAGN